MHYRTAEIENKQNKRNFPLQKIRVDSNSFLKKDNYLQLKDLVRIGPFGNSMQKNIKTHKSEQSTYRKLQQINHAENIIQGKQQRQRSNTVSLTKNLGRIKIDKNQNNLSKFKINKISVKCPQSSKNHKLKINNQTLLTSLHKIAQKIEEISQIHMEKLFMSQVQNFYEEISTKTKEYCWILRKIFNLVDYCQKRRSNFFINQQYSQSQDQKRQLLRQINQKQVKLNYLKQKIEQRNEKIKQLQLQGPITYICNCRNIIKDYIASQQKIKKMGQLDLSQISQVHSLKIPQQNKLVQHQFFNTQLVIKKDQITSSENEFLIQKTVQSVKQHKIPLQIIEIENKETIIKNRSSIIRQKFAKIVQNFPSLGESYK